MKRYISLILLSAVFIGILKAQTKADSLLIVSAPWNIHEVCKGIVHKSVFIDSLYHGNQSINVIEISPKSKSKIGIAVTGKRDTISRRAYDYNALAAINGSYFNMKEGNSICYLKTNKEVIDTTTISEFNLRVTGAIHIKKGKLTLIPWSRDIEKNYSTKRNESILASGPLMLLNGNYYDWSMCDKNFIQTKHPRSAICLTKDKKILFVTIDGRHSGKADGMNIPELAHFLKVLGCEEAINLDGGGSTSLWLSGATENGIVNYPCDNKKFDHRGERTIPNFLYIYK